ncbi:tyrosine-type recombinase/integrase [Pseudofrankia inefficax]|uniref:Integrase family protein n=1 Tax=Pseudofrankia inefficax (strain DSM 45817 / CECT 9037 / DDB 130130 / EuI1c) TaxID=298654 RepID=E3J744_PSEI1|nr:tyrosine-type recombinase/integrase [Pseudofrankia inefficax]ADP84408.1 integrase family protein [Pseudofrankia inefficax]
MPDVPGTALDVLPAAGAVALAGDRDPWPALVALWLDSGFSPRTREAYGRAVAEWTRACEAWGIHPLDARRPHADRWARDLEAAGQASTTIGRKLASVASVYAYALDEHLIDASPLAKVKRPKTTDRHQAPGMTLDQARAFLAAADADGPRTSALMRLLLANGLRVSEAIEADVDQLGHERGHRVLRIVGKGSKAATVVLAPPTARAIDAYLAGRTAGPLFVTATGNRLDRPAVWRTIRRLAKRAGLGDLQLSPHSLRATSVTLLLDAGASLRDAQDHARHADPRTTRAYDRARGSLDRAGTYQLVAYLDA